MELAPEPNVPASAASPQDTQSYPIFPLWKSMVAILVIALSGLLVYSGRGVNGQTGAGVTMKLPDSVGNYLGFGVEVSEAERIILPKDTEFANKRYVGPTPEQINCEIVLSGAQRNSIHRPQICLVGQGWTIHEERAIPIQLANGRQQRVRLLTISRIESGRTVLGYYLYWFVGKDKTTDDHFERIFLTSWDRIVHRVNHRWAYVIVSSLLPGDQLSDKEKSRVANNLIGFTREIIPKIQNPAVNQPATTP
jgi:hypothetical protein